MSAVIFIGSPEKFDKNSNKSNWRHLFYVNPYDLIFRIFASFIPPFGFNFRKVYVDFFGPILAIIQLFFILNYAHYVKVNKASLQPNEFLFSYVVLMPILCYVCAKIGLSHINLVEIVALLGYALYGHIFTLIASYICFHETSNTFFFISLIIFNGLSTFRLVLILLKSIPKAGPRLIVCSCIGILQILSLIFIHFAYMHQTFIYGQN